ILMKGLPAATTCIYFDSQTESAASVLSRAISIAKSMNVAPESIMIFSHGQAGEFALGNKIISEQTLNSTGLEWKALAAQLAPDASIELFACDLAADPQGMELINRIHDLTGARIFASTNLTGKDGDWILEAHSSGADQEAMPLVRADVLDAYSADLGIVT